MLSFRRGVYIYDNELRKFVRSNGISISVNCTVNTLKRYNEMRLNSRAGWNRCVIKIGRAGSGIERVAWQCFHDEREISAMSYYLKLRGNKGLSYDDTKHSSFVSFFIRARRGNLCGETGVEVVFFSPSSTTAINAPRGTWKLYRRSPFSFFGGRPACLDIGIRRVNDVHGN